MATKATITLDEFLKLPETKPASEYVRGRVVQKLGGSEDHAFIQAYLAVLLWPYLESNRVGRAGISWTCVFGPSGDKRVLTPDITYVAREHLAHTGYHLRAPDLAIEVLSPGEAGLDFREKIDFYLHNGTHLLWVFEPEVREVSVFAPGVEPFTLGAGETLDGGDLLPGFTLGVDDVFAQLDT